MTSKKFEKEEFVLGEKCKATFDALGNVTLGEGCKGLNINPIEIELINRTTRILRKEEEE